MAFGECAVRPALPGAVANRATVGASSIQQLQHLQQYCKMQQIKETRMATYSTSDLSRKSGDIIADALRSPVTITQRRKPRLVLLSIEDYRRLTARADTRIVGTLETMPDPLFEDFVGAIDAYDRDGETR
jgi:prevent-host-death family protein